MDVNADNAARGISTFEALICVSLFSMLSLWAIKPLNQGLEHAGRFVEEDLRLAIESAQTRALISGRPTIIRFDRNGWSLSQPTTLDSKHQAVESVGSGRWTNPKLVRFELEPDEASGDTPSLVFNDDGSTIPKSVTVLFGNSDEIRCNLSKLGDLKCR